MELVSPFGLGWLKFRGLSSGLYGNSKVALLQLMLWALHEPAGILTFST
jgi:hypothetical protein